MMNKRTIIIGSRASQLALIQTNFVKKSLENFFPNLTFEVKTFSTKGDQNLSVGLSAIGDKGLFTRELEDAIMSNEIDFAVHSLKDLPTELPEGLCISAVTEREHANDVLISVHSFLGLPQGSIVGTSSLRRRSQLMNIRKDLVYKDIRGNLNTRLRKLFNKEYDAIVLAFAGINRLGIKEAISIIFDTSLLIPAAGQGALAIESRQGDDEINNIVKFVHHEQTARATTAERAFLKALKGGCQVPIGAYAEGDETLTLTGFISDLDATRFLQASMQGNTPELLGLQLAEELIRQGADEIVQELTASRT